MHRTTLRPIVACTRRDDELDRLVDRAGGTIVTLDLTAPASVDGAADAILARFPEHGWIDSLVLLASPPPKIAGFRQQGADELAHQLTVQVTGPYRLLQALLGRHLVSRRRGKVISVSSAALKRAIDGHASHMSAYVVGKAAQQMLLTEMANEYKWLTVKHLFPGHVDTRMLEAFDPRYVDQLRQLGRITPPEHVADQIIDMLTDEQDLP